MSQARRQRRAAKRRETPAKSPARPVAFPREALFVSIGLAIAVGIIYWPVHGFGFVRFDDPTYVTENPHLVNGLTWSSVAWALTSGYAANWHPLTWVSHLADVQFFGFDAGVHHVENVLLHAATTVLLFGVLFWTTGALWRSAFVAGMFGVHPIHVESVAWIAERKDVLSAFFWTVSVWAYVAYVRRPGAVRYTWVVVSFALGLMAKPMVVTLPFVLLLLDVWPLRRIGVDGEGWRGARSCVLEKLPLFAMSLASSVITFVVQQRGGTVASGVRLPLDERLGNAAISYVVYLGKTLWPLHLAAYYPYARLLSSTGVAAASLCLIAASAGAALATRRHPYLLVGWLWYLGTLVPTIGIVQVGTQAMADRYTYIPLIGIFIIVAWGVADLIDGRRQWRVPTSVIATGVLVLCAIGARSQVWSWKDSATLWRHALAVTSDNYAAHTYYGNALASQGNAAAAIAEYTEAIRIRPDYAEAHNNLGPVLARQGRLDEAIQQFTAAIRLRPNYVDAYNNLGVALASQGKLDEAIARYGEALRIDPDDARAHANLGLALRARGRPDDAQRELEVAVRLNPSNVDARTALEALRAKRR